MNWKSFPCVLFSVLNSNCFYPQDWADIDFGIAEGVDFFALSFVNHADSVKDLKMYLSTKSTK